MTIVEISTVADDAARDPVVPASNVIETTLTTARERRAELAAGLPAQREALARMTDELFRLQAEGQPTPKLERECVRARVAIEKDEGAIKYLNDRIANAEHELKAARVREAEDDVCEKSAMAVEAAVALDVRIAEILVLLAPDIARLMAAIGGAAEAEKNVAKLRGAHVRSQPRVLDAIGNRAPTLLHQMTTLHTLADNRRKSDTHVASIDQGNSND